MESRTFLSASISRMPHGRHVDGNLTHEDTPADVLMSQPQPSASDASIGIAQFKRVDPIIAKRSAKLANYTPINGAYTPTQLRTAYGINALSTSNQGQGMTIGIVDEFDDTAITSDTNAFSAHYGLPQFNVSGGPTMTVYKDQALGTVATASGTGVALETSLDVEWAHAMAPKANILLVEVPASGTIANYFAQLLHGVQYAASQPNVGAVSLSYGYGESNIGSSNVTSLDSTYLASGAAASVAITVSSGDDSSPSYPATSPNVIAVGGSSLYFSALRGKYSFETAWGGLKGAGAGGGGLSSTFAAPSFQSSHGVSFSNRAIPDISLDADEVTGVSVYDSLDATTSAPSPWTEVGGTSLAAPLFGGVVTLAQQLRVSSSKALLSSTQIDSEMYTLYNSSNYGSDFHDIKQGNNRNVSTSGTTTVAGFSATGGYDEATGIGSPIANSLISVLASI